MQTLHTPVQALRAMGVVPREIKRHPVRAVTVGVHGWTCVGPLHDRSELFLIRGPGEKHEGHCAAVLHDDWWLDQNGNLSDDEYARWWPVLRRCTVSCYWDEPAAMPLPVYLSTPRPNRIAAAPERKEYLTLALLGAAKSLPQNSGCALTVLPREMVREIAGMLYT